jgi:1-acyl-sn-glycerol-3-phosphate acyltransferase
MGRQADAGLPQQAQCRLRENRVTVPEAPLVTRRRPGQVACVLPAQKHHLRGALLFTYIRWILRRHFDAVRVFGERPELHQDDAYPLVVYSTHQSWWDGFLEVPLVQRYGQDLHLMMDEVNLRKFPAFRWVGVFGVDLASAGGRAAALRYAAHRLRGGSRRCALYLYPHGRILRPHAPWPAFGGGVEALLRLCPGARALPVAKELFHGRFRDPEAWIELGQPLRGTTAELEGALRDVASRLRARIAADDATGAIELLPPKRWSTGRT